MVVTPKAVNYVTWHGIVNGDNASITMITAKNINGSDTKNKNGDAQ